MTKVLGQSLQRPAKSRVTIVRCHIASRLEHELSRRVPRMGHDQARSPADEFAVQDHVQVDRPGIPSLAALPTKLFLDVLKQLQDLTGRSGCVECGDCIEKRFLTARASDRWRFEQPARAKSLDQTGGSDPPRRFSDQAIPVSEIAAEADQTLSNHAGSAYLGIVRKCSGHKPCDGLPSQSIHARQARKIDGLGSPSYTFSGSTRDYPMVSILVGDHELTGDRRF